MVARAVQDGRVINEVPLRYAGEKSTFAGRVPLSTAGPIELEVLAMDHSLSTTRRLWSTGGVSSCYHAATGTPHTRSIQEHHRSIQIVGFLWGEVLLGLLRWYLGIIRNQQVSSSDHYVVLQVFLRAPLRKQGGRGGKRNEVGGTPTGKHKAIFRPAK